MPAGRIRKGGRKLGPISCTGLPILEGFDYVAHRAGRAFACPSLLEDSRRGVALGHVSDRPTEENDMPLYEHVFLARQDLAQAQVDALAENATKILTDNGGKVVKTETWGLKSLAYKIAKNRKAHFVMLDVDAPAPAIAELERQTNINEDVIRFMTIRVDEHESGPSAMMRRERGSRDRGERGERVGRGREDEE
jgi:small subunit ribosomal protein S6